MNKIQRDCPKLRYHNIDVIVLGRVSTTIKAGIPAHVLSILETLSDSGLRFVNIAPSLSALNNPFHIFGSSFRQINTSSTEFLCNSLFVYKTLGFSISFIIYFFKLIYENPDAVVHVHLPDPLSILVTLLCRRRRIVATFHADLLNKGIFSYLYNRALSLFSAKHNVVFVTPTPAHAKSSSLANFACCPVVLPFIFNDKPLSTESSILLQDAYSSLKTRFIFVGRHVAYKGVNVAINAFMNLPQSLNCDFTIAGEGPLTSTLQRLASNDTRINFVGLLRDDDLVRYYLKSHVFILPSVTQAEAFGIVQVEAMLHHCLCLSSFLDNGVNFVNSEGVSGFNFPVNDVQALTLLMRSLCLDIHKRNQLMSSARDYALSTFASSDLRQSYLDLYTSRP